MDTAFHAVTPLGTLGTLSLSQHFALALVGPSVACCAPSHSSSPVPARTKAKGHLKCLHGCKASMQQQQKSHWCKLLGKLFRIFLYFAQTSNTIIFFLVIIYLTCQLLCDFFLGKAVPSVSSAILSHYLKFA